MTRPTSNLPSQGRCIIIALSGATHERPGKNGEVNELIVYNTSALYDTFRSTPISSLYPLISVYISLREICPIPSFLESPRGKSQISTWIFFVFHVGVKKILRSFSSFFRSFILCPRGGFSFSTWIFQNPHVEISFPRHGVRLICSRI